MGGAGGEGGDAQVGTNSPSNAEAGNGGSGGNGFDSFASIGNAAIGGNGGAGGNATAPAVWGAPAAKAGMPRWAPILPATRKPVTAAAAGYLLQNGRRGRQARYCRMLARLGDPWLGDEVLRSEVPGWHLVSAV